MPTKVARFKRRLRRRDWGLIVLAVLLGGLVLMTGHLARDDASSVATEEAVHQVKVEAYRQDIDAWHSRVKGCERGKQDRTSTARMARAQSDYLNLVLDAASVKQDVKAAAAVNQRIQDAAAADLESRTGKNLDCRDAYPKPPAPRGVNELP